MYTTDDGGLDVWQHGAPYPGNRLARCYKQTNGGNGVECGTNGDPTCYNGQTTAHDVFVYADTNLCS